VLDENVNQARELVSHLVSRDTRKLSKNELVSATVESLTENINDSVTAPLFYVLAAGILVTFLFSLFNLNIFLNLNIPLTTSNNTNWLFEVGNSLTTSWYSFILITLPILSGVLYRVVNTLDAMVGYDNMKYRMIGYFPAKLDDVLNFLPSRITGIMVVIAAAMSGMNWRNSWITMKLDAQKTPSPNSGYPMAAAAGALNVQLKKPGIYVLGKPTDTLDSNLIGKAIFLTKITIILYLMFSFIFYLILYLLITSI
jgi:adenosylcobinamide-phosphate synthase